MIAALTAATGYSSVVKVSVAIGGAASVIDKKANEIAFELSVTSHESEKSDGTNTGLRCGDMAQSQRCVRPRNKNPN